MNIGKAGMDHINRAYTTIPVWQKHGNNALQAATDWKNTDDKTVGKAAEVYISDAGRKMRRDAHDPLTIMTSTGYITDSEKKLDEQREQKKQLAEYKKQADILQNKVDTDSSLSSNDRETMQKEANRLRDMSMTDDDKLNALYDKRKALKKALAENADSYTDEQKAVYQQQINKMTSDIHTKYLSWFTDVFRQKDFKQETLELSALAEHGKFDVAQNDAKIQNVKLELRSSDAAMSVRSKDQINDQAQENVRDIPTAQDVIQQHIAEGHEIAEKAESQQEKLDGDSATAKTGRDVSRVLSLNEKTINQVDDKDIDKATEALKKLQNKMKKMTPEKALQLEKSTK